MSRKHPSDTPWTLGVAGLALVVAAPLLFRPWAAIHVDSYRAYDWLEAAKYRWFARQMVLEDHCLPLWCPFLEGGIPSYAHPTDGSLSPFFLTSLVFGDVLGMKLDVVLLAVLGSVGVFALARGWLELDRGAAFVAAASFAVCGWLPSRLAVGFYESCWMAIAPLAMAMMIRGLRHEELRRGVPWFVGATALLAAAGVQMQHCLTFTLLQLVMWSVVCRDGWRRGRPALLGIVLVCTVGVAALAAIKFVPMVEFLHDRGWRPVGTEEYPVSLLGGLGGILGGLFRTATVLGSYELDGSPMDEYTYVGLPLLCALLCPVALLSRIPGARAVGGLALLTWGLEWSAGPGTQLSLFSLLHPLPLLDSIRNTTPYVSTFLAMWLCLLAGAGYRALCAHRWVRRLPPLVLLAIAAAALAPSGVRSAALYARIFSHPATSPVTDTYHQVSLVGSPAPGASSFNTAIYDHLRSGVGVVHAAEDLPGGPAVVEGRRVNGPDGRSFENPDYRGELWLRSGRGAPRGLEPGPNRLRFHLYSDGPVEVVLNHNAHRDWRSADGFEVTGHGGLLTVAVPQAHDGPVELVFRPRAIRWGALITGVTIVMMSVLLAWAWIGRRIWRA